MGERQPVPEELLTKGPQGEKEKRFFEGKKPADAIQFDAPPVKAPDPDADENLVHLKKAA